MWERSDSVVECLTRDQGAAGWSLTTATVLCPSLVLVQPRKTHPFIEIMLMGRKEIKLNKQTIKPLFCLFLSGGLGQVLLYYHFPTFSSRLGFLEYKMDDDHTGRSCWWSRTTHGFLLPLLQVSHSYLPLYNI